MIESDDGSMRVFERLQDLYRPSRRRFLLGFVLLLLRPRNLWAAIDSDAGEKTVRALCDRFVPKYGAHPGALALGVDAEVLAWFRAKKLRSVVLDSTVAELAREDFLALSNDAQDRLLAGYVDSKNGAATAEALRVLRNSVVVLYFSKRESWAPIAYRTPQPAGYPDYAECAKGRAADGRAG